MYTISVPIALQTITEDTLPRHLELLKNMGAQRVFLCCIGEIYRKDSWLYMYRSRIRWAVDQLRLWGYEVGIWVNTFGHGALLSHQSRRDVGNYTPIADCHGRTAPVAYCPLDERFRKDFLEGLEVVASCAPDLIMLDDDMRFNLRKQYFSLGCFCPEHLKEYYRLLGEELPPEEIENRIFTGGPNHYRSQYFKMMGKTLLDFAADMRKTVDRVDKTIRLGACICSSIWDCSGAEPLRLAKTLAGKHTRPFLRIAGAPYHNVNILPIIERSRQQKAWLGDGDVELMCEGDTYPRPRYNVPSRPLELFDFAMACDGTVGGMLQYAFDYTHSLSYEQGYAKRLGRNRPVREAAMALFAGKSAVGVEVFDAQHKMHKWVLPDELGDNTVQWLQATPSKGFAELLSRNGIPTAYGETEYPVLVLGENGRHVPLEKLSRGAILDAQAAQLLKNRGVDTGLLGLRPGHSEEYFVDSYETVRGIGAEGKVGMETAGTPESLYRQDADVASYRYENKKGQRFFVLGCNFHQPGVFMNANYLCSWARRRQLQAVIPWLCGKALPAVLDDAPDAHILVGRGEKGMAVAITNSYYDEIIDPVIPLDKPYKTVRFVNCSGRLEGDQVHLETLPPFSFAAFEVEE